MLLISRPLALYLAFFVFIGCPAASDTKQQDSDVAQKTDPDAPRNTGTIDAQAERKAQEEPDASPGSDPGSAESIASSSNLPTAEQEKKTPLPERTPIIPDASIQSTLPCPEGSRQFTLDNSISCRKPPEHRGGVPEAHGPIIVFHPNGAVKTEAQYVNGRAEGQRWQFREDGSLEQYAEYGDGELDGLRIRYFSNGQRELEQRYRAGKLHGIGKIWNDQGGLWAISTYDRDKMVESQHFQAHSMKLPTDPEVLSAMEEMYADMLKHADPEERKLLEEALKETKEHIRQQRE